MNNRKTTALRGAAILLAAVVLAACGNFLTSDQSPKQYYTLLPAELPETRWESGQLHSAVVNVTAVPGLDTDRILALDPDSALSRYSNARWPDFLPEVLASVIARSLHGSEGFMAVRPAQRASAGEWSIELEVQQFYGIRGADGNTNSVRLDLVGSVSCFGETHPLELGSSRRVGEQRLAAVVAAHQSALDDATRQLLDQLKHLCSAA